MKLSVGILIAVLMSGAVYAYYMISDNKISISVSTATPQPAEPTPTTTPLTTSTAEAIYFVKYDRNSYAGVERVEFYKINPDGTDLTLLYGYPTNVVIENFFISPDGQKIVYSTIPESDIYVISTQGGQPVNLTNTPDWPESNPVWSPDGQKIVFERSYLHENAAGNPDLTTSDLYLMNANSTNQINLTHNQPKQYSHKAVLTPDGQRLAFTLTKTDGEVAIDNVYTMNIRCAGLSAGCDPELINLTPNLAAYPVGYEWLADGQQLIISTFSGGTYTVNADGTNLTLVDLPSLADDTFFDNLKWSPDGQHVALCGYISSTFCTLFIMNPDGTALTQISDSPLFVFPTTLIWSPDGQQLIFSAASKLAKPDNLKYALYEANITTLKSTRLTEAKFDDLGPIRWWSPPGNNASTTVAPVITPPISPSPLPTVNSNPSVSQSGPPPGATMVNFTQTQSNPYWKTYTREDAPSGYMTDMLIDNAGRKWIGSSMGLAIFDGQSWQVYTSTHGLLHDWVTALALDPAGHIWVGYDSGLSVFDGQYWQHYTLALDMVGNSIRDLAVDSAGRLWFTTGRDWGMFDGQNWTVYQTVPLANIPSPPLETPLNAPLIKAQVVELGPEHAGYHGLSAFAVDQSGQLWAIGWGYLGIFDGQQWQSYALEDTYLNYPKIIVDRPNGQVWLATDSGASVLTLLPLNQPEGVGAQNWTHYNQMNGPARDDLYALALDPAGRKWFGSDAGVSVFDGESWLTYTQADGLTPGPIRVIAVDSAGHLWFGAALGELSEFTPPPIPTPLPTPAAEVIPRITQFTLTPTTALTTGDVLSFTWRAVGKKAQICFISGRPDRCQEVSLSGSRAITVEAGMFATAISGAWLQVTTPDDATDAFIDLDFQCFHGWFFVADRSTGCPEAEPIYSRAAAQYFEHGLMIWTEQPDSFYIFFDRDHLFTSYGAEWVKEPDFLATPEPLPTLPGVLATPVSLPDTPPPGYLEPISGFGRVWHNFWRYDNNFPVSVAQDIGWATGQEFEFETAYQCAQATSAYGPWTCYLRSPAGTVLSFAPLSTIRDRWVWQEH